MIVGRGEKHQLAPAQRMSCKVFISMGDLVQTNRSTDYVYSGLLKIR